MQQQHETFHAEIAPPAFVGAPVKDFWVVLENASGKRSHAFYVSARDKASVKTELAAQFKLAFSYDLPEGTKIQSIED